MQSELHVVYPLSMHMAARPVTESPNPSVMAELRIATSHHHASLDSDSRLDRYFQSKSELAKLLGRWYGFLKPFESLLSHAASSSEALISSRTKLPCLATDLRLHGVDLCSLPLCRDLPQLGNEKEALGAMYVTEGATLGGRVLSRRIEQRLGLRDGVGYSFFNCYGSDDNPGLRNRQSGK